MTTGSHLVHFLGDVGEEELAGEDRGGALHPNLEERAFLLHKAESKSISALRTEAQKQTNRTKTHKGTKYSPAITCDGLPAVEFRNVKLPSLPPPILPAMLASQ